MKGDFQKKKAGFWCPPDIEREIKVLVEKGVHPDTSKAIVALIRKGLEKEHQFAPDLRIKIEALADLLQRKPEVVVGQCVEGILEMVEAGKPILPLIVEETDLRLRKNGASDGNRGWW